MRTEGRSEKEKEASPWSSSGLTDSREAPSYANYSALVSCYPLAGYTPIRRASSGRAQKLEREEERRCVRATSACYR